jgi:hypothetical protein
MFSWPAILCAFLLLRCLSAHGADAIEARERYRARLDGIARSYREQFTEILKKQRSVGSEKPALLSAEQEIKELARRRTEAIAEAKFLYEKEQREQKQTDLTPPTGVSREQRQREFMAARRQAVEDGQKAFWDRVSRAEPKVAELRAARLQSVEEAQAGFWTDVALREAQEAERRAERRQAVEDAQNAFWAELFGPPKTIPHDQPPVASTQKDSRRVQEPTSPQSQRKNARAQIQYGREFVAAH